MSNLELPRQLYVHGESDGYGGILYTVSADPADFVDFEGTREVILYKSVKMVTIINKTTVE